MPTLAEVFGLLDERGADDVFVNLETKFEVSAPAETEPRERFVDVVCTTLEDHGMLERASVQSFDWGILRLLRERASSVRLNALTSGHYLEAGQPGGSPWMDGLDIDHFGGDLVAAAASRGFHAVSPIHGSPFLSGVGDPAYRPFVTPSMVARAHDAGMRVLPYTVDDPDTMRALLELGVDGLITNYPDRLRAVLAEAGRDLPKPRP
jgi:glycerophosphoryl diester phosphodiesterase